MKGLLGTMTEILWIEPLPFVALVRTLILCIQLATTYTSPLSLVHDELLQTWPPEQRPLIGTGVTSQLPGSAPVIPYSARFKAEALFGVSPESGGPNESPGAPELHEGATITPSVCLRLSCDRNQPATMGR
jgi:hypothetical protein